jgi:streptogramin lyase
VSEIRDGEVRRAAYVRGAPHAVIEGTGGWLYVTQAGKVTIGEHVTRDPVPAGIQRVSPAGEISYVVSAEDHPEISSPNYLCFGPDGRLYFTDTGGSFDPSDASQVGRVFAVDEAEGFVYYVMAYVDGEYWTLGERLVQLLLGRRRMPFCSAACSSRMAQCCLGQGCFALTMAF